MNHRRLTLLFLVLFFPLSARSQLPSAELLTLTPPVLCAGETTEITVGGLNLEDLTALSFSDQRITAELVAGTKKFRVTVPAEVAADLVEVRADGYFGRSTSRLLSVVAKGTVILAAAGAAPAAGAEAPVLPLEACVYGTTRANQIDRWKVVLTEGQRLLVHALAERLDSRADASLVLTDLAGKDLASSHNVIGRDPLLDFTAPESGEYLVGIHDFLFNGGAEYPYLLIASTRPWVDAVYPPAGQEGQVLKATLLGRNLPGGSAGEGFAVDGKSLETLSLSIPVAAPEGPRADPALPARAILPGFSFRQGESNAVRIGIAQESVLNEQNDAALPILTGPVEIAARFDHPGDTDQVRLSAKAGTAYGIEVIGDRLAGLVDPYLVVETVNKGADGTETFALLREGDDTPAAPGTRLLSGSRDPSLMIAAGAAMDYRITTINQFGSGGPAHLYRLVLREARPDFELLAVTERSHYELTQAHPAAPLLRKGGTEPVRVLVRRRDGFDGPITLEATGLPPGVICPAVIAAPKEDSVRLVFSASPDAAGWAGDIHIVGKGSVGGVEIVREARAASFVQGIADAAKERLRPRLTVTLPLSVSATEKAPLSLEVGNGGSFSVVMGEKLEIPVKVVGRNGVKGPLTITLDGLHGLKQSTVLTLADKVDEGKLVLNFTAQNAVFAPEAGTWTCLLKATAVTSYRYRPEAAALAAADLKKADDALKAATAETKPGLTKARGVAEAKAKALTAAAVAKDLKFSAYTLPVTIEVKPAPKKDS